MCGKHERWLLVVQDSTEVWGHQSVVASFHSVGKFYFLFVLIPSVFISGVRMATWDKVDLCIYPGQFPQGGQGIFMVKEMKILH